MSRTYRRPPPRRRLRAGYTSRLCWRCRCPVAKCDCPARALVVAPTVEDPKLVDEAFFAACAPEWRACWDYREWTAVDAALEKAGLKRPRTLTIQGYAHDEQPWTVTDAVLANRDKPLIIWCEPFPSATTLRCLRGCAEIVKRGFVKPGENHREGIKAFQRDAGITADGWLGNEGLRALGL